MKVLPVNLKFSIKAAGTALPENQAITNLDILKKNPETREKSIAILQKLDQKITQDYGIQQRYWCHWPGNNLNDASETSESLSYKAVKDAFGFRLPEIEAFILGSTTTCRYAGSQATAVLGKFNCSAAAYEIKAGCSTSLATLHLAHMLLQGGYQNVLVSAAETLSKVISIKEKETWFGLADGAAAIWLEKNNDGEFLVEKTIYSTEGIYADLYTTPSPLPPTIENLSNEGYCLAGDSKALQQLANERYCAMIENLLPTLNERDEIQWIIPHQVNLSLIKNVIEKMNLNKAKIIWNADQVGNLGGTSILYSLADSVKKQIFDKPAKILLMSVGGGLSYCAQIWTVNPR